MKIYVSVSGNDRNPGTKELPTASLYGAVSKLRTSKKTHSVDGPIEVIVGNGEYFITEPLELHPEDSGTTDAPVTFKAEEGAHPVFFGGRQIMGFEKVSETLWIPVGSGISTVRVICIIKVHT